MPYYPPSSGGGTPGGSSGQVQYNNAGAFGGVTGLTLAAGVLAAVAMAGSISAAAWTTTGVRLTTPAATLTDTTSAGTVAAAYSSVLGADTIAANSAVTFTDYCALFIKEPVAGTNVTLTNKWSLGLEGGLFTNGQLQLRGPSASFKSLLLIASGGSTSNAFGFSVSTSAMTVYQGNSTLFAFGAGDFQLRSDGSFAWCSTTNPAGTIDLRLTRGGANILQLGAADAASPTAQTLGVQNVVAGTTNTAGVALNVRGGAGTGTGAGGPINLQIALAGSTGTAQNAWTTIGVLDGTGNFSLQSPASNFKQLTLIASGGSTGNAFSLSAFSTTSFVISFGNSQALAINSVQPQIRSDSYYAWSTNTSANGSADLLIGRALAKVLSIEGASTTGGTYRTIATTPAAITADQNNYAPGGTSRFQRWSSDASRTVTGLSLSQADGQKHVIVNVGANNIILANESASSTAANRFSCSTGADITLSAGQAADLEYDTTSARWRVFKRN